VYIVTTIGALLLGHYLTREVRLVQPIDWSTSWWFPSHAMFIVCVYVLFLPDTIARHINIGRGSVLDWAVFAFGVFLLAVAIAEILFGLPGLNRAKRRERLAIILPLQMPGIVASSLRSYDDTNAFILDFIGGSYKNHGPSRIVSQ
jgi:hypothetical protein